jgi:type VII secretion effector (TIGR04197 family)
MSGNIAVDSVILEERATALKSVGERFDNHALSQADAISTITANQSAQSAFVETKQGHSLYSNALYASATQIKEIGDEFFTVDRHGVRNFNNRAGLPTQS